MISNNIIVFPKDRNDTPPQRLEDVLDIADENQREAVEAAVDEVVPMLLSNLGKFNLYIEDEKDIGMIIESIKSGVFRSLNIKHDLQEYTDQLIKLV